MRATLDVLRAQLEEHADLPPSPDGPHGVCHPDEADWIDLEGKLVWADGEATFAFGKYQGVTLRELAAAEPGYLEWLLGGDFDPELKEIVRRALQGDLPVR